MKTNYFSLILAFSLLSCGGPQANANLEPSTFSNYDQNLTTSVIQVEGMTCKGCENSIKGTLGKMPGVKVVKASHQEKTVTITYDPEIISLENLKQAITDIGYQVL